MSKLTLARAKEILPKYTTESHLFTHAACVSAAMGAMADCFGEDKDHWEAIGWLHDVDYERYPSTEEHCHHVREFLEPEGVDAVVGDVRAIFVGSPDSIWVCDEAIHLLLLDANGKVCRSSQYVFA